MPKALQWGLFSDGQVVATSDAAALAHALSGTSRDLPEEGVPLEPWPRLEVPCGEPLELMEWGSWFSPYEPFVGERGRQRLAQIVRFCRRGAFAIT